MSMAAEERWHGTSGCGKMGAGDAGEAAHAKRTKTPQLLVNSGSGDRLNT
jgi:hypothetical protein